MTETMLRITAGVTRFGQADIVKQIWKELPKHMDTPVAPLDEEMLVDLAKEPAVIEGRPLGADLHIGRGKWLQSSKVYHFGPFCNLTVCYDKCKLIGKSW